MKRILFSIVCVSLVTTCFAGADVSDKNAQLLQTAKDGNLPAVQTALTNGADVNAKDKNGTTALMIASHEGYTNIVKLLLEKGAYVNVKRTTNGTTALWQASNDGNTELVKLLLEKGADVNVKATVNGVEWTALKLTKVEGHTDIVQLLEKAGAKE